VGDGARGGAVLGRPLSAASPAGGEREAERQGDGEGGAGPGGQEGDAAHEAPRQGRADTGGHDGGQVSAPTLKRARLERVTPAMATTTGAGVFPDPHPAPGAIAAVTTTARGAERRMPRPWYERRDEADELPQPPPLASPRALREARAARGVGGRAGRAAPR